MSKSFATNSTDALALATQAAAARMSKKTPAPAPAVAASLPVSESSPVAARTPPKLQFNVMLSLAAHAKLKNAAFAWGTTPRELIEAFAAQLPDVAVPVPEAPEAIAWAKPASKGGV